jgi:exodeoxyribonuclease VII small subunit
MTKKSKQPSTFNFETSLEHLEKIVSKIESGQLSLQDSLTQFEEGMQLAKACQEHLNTASGKIEKVVKDLGGNEQLQEMRPEDFDRK